MSEVFMEKKKSNKALSIAVNALLYLFLIVSVLSVFITISSKNSSSKDATDIFGYQMRIVVSDSMAKCEHTDVSRYDIKSIPLKSMVFVEKVPENPTEAAAWYGKLKVGDVLTFKYVYTTQVTITHRIVSITKLETGGYKIVLEGDNKNSADAELLQQVIDDTSDPNNFNHVIGKVTGQSYILGVILSFLMTTQGLVFVIIFPCLIIIMFEVIKITKVLGAEKRAREKEEQSTKTEQELLELRRRIAELENGVTNNTDTKEE